VHYILQTFPIVERKEAKAYGEYRTRNAILEIHCSMEQSVAGRVPYETQLSPPPGHPSAAPKRKETY
jgi:hypothetical protein